MEIGVYTVKAVLQGGFNGKPWMGNQNVPRRGRKGVCPSKGEVIPTWATAGCGQVTQGQ